MHDHNAGEEQWLCVHVVIGYNKLATTETRSNILNEINSILINSPSNLYNSYVEHTENLYSTSSYETNLNEIESSSKTIIAFDQISHESLLRKIYSWNPLINFITDVIQIYPSCDDLGALYINIYRQSNKLSWHTDHSHFFVNLILQQASMSNEADGLELFNGRTYSHRVAEIRLSKLPRINAILTYDCHPDHRLSDYVL
ncbi:unnamed protein product [Rotaria magnacalcarata]|uniref:Uncharacterized protein n=2 Tax=Rotaria magnacalcarata TaxID=392030 RepID=A0A816CPL3_9BILA|nr:unnamed protein product [Rotaria magnacalcarata]CAF1624488.1 unnamed protein product [Rotaria magnacalcarata]CAF3842674.1 unnamed protein product [Rotaria magnacalcarata]